MRPEFWSFYDVQTGEISTRRVSSTTGLNLEKLTPTGCAPIAGRYDRRTQRVDIATGAIVERIRTRAEVDAEAQQAARVAALERISQLEQQQARPMRELALDATNADARARLAALEGQITALRESLSSAAGSR